MTAPLLPSDAQRREEADPAERVRPMPLAVAVITLAVVLVGVAYILRSDLFGAAELGDRRTLADLRPKAQGSGANAVDGKQIFAANCAACHQGTGLGLPGAFPPLDGSEWVAMNPRVIANILLYGIGGTLTVNGASFQGSMPSFARLGDDELAAVASYVRGEWSNRAAPIGADVFARERKAARRKDPFASGDELKAVAATPP